MKLIMLIISMFYSLSLLAEPLEVAFVYVSPVGEVGWSKTHDEARLHLEKVFGTDVRTQFVESVAEGFPSRKVITDLAEKGADLIFTTSWGYMVPTQRVASMFPDTKFENATGLRKRDNLSTYANRAYEGRYLAGVLAGRMTQSNKIGYVAAYPVVEVIRGINAFTLGARSVNPKVEVHTQWTKSWYNPQLSADLTHKLIDEGADVITQHTDSPAPLKAAEERGVYSIGYHSDMSNYAPKHHLASVVHDWSKLYEQRVSAVKSQSWESGESWPGLKEGAVKLSSVSPAVPIRVQAEIAQVKKNIISGKTKIFAGPIQNHRGRTKIRKGRVLTDDDLIRMSWYVEGVKGNLSSF